MCKSVYLYLFSKNEMVFFFSKEFPYIRKICIIKKVIFACVCGWVQNTNQANFGELIFFLSDDSYKY